MRKLIILLFITLSAFGCNNEQKRIDRIATKMVNNINTACQLNADQQAKIKEAALKFVKARTDNNDKYAQNQEVLLNMNATAKSD